jgi:hypothetical protein
MINNDRQQAMQGITVKGFFQELFQRLSENKEKVVATVAKHFTNHKETHKTDESGRYIFIVYKHEFEAAQNFIANFCKTVFPRLYPS